MGIMDLDTAVARSIADPQVAGDDGPIDDLKVLKLLKEAQKRYLLPDSGNP